MTNLGETLTAADGDALARLTAHLLRGWAYEAIAEHGVFRVALSGGSTPRAMFRVLAGLPFPWDRTEVFWVDERAVPPSSDRSNYGAAKADLFGTMPSPPRGLYAMPGAAPDLDAGAKSYEAVIAKSFGQADGLPAFDTILLGIGDDGHTASLFPGDPYVDVEDRWVVGVAAAEGREARLSLTRPVLTAAKRLVVVAQGASKREPIARARAAGALSDTPSRLVQQAKGELLWLLDAAAAPPRLPFPHSTTHRGPITAAPQETDMPDFDKLAAAATIARGLAMDAVHACSSGHLGLPLGAAEVGAALYGDLLRHDPSDAGWLGRDRFVLSAGHGSMFLYAWLHLSGYDLSLDEVKKFRQWESKTPGHPEFHYTPGVEATTGPLGQGVGNAVGHAVAAKMLAATYNTKDHTIFAPTIWCLAGDGCLQEGVAAEAASFAGHFKLDNLVLMYDSNDVTLDAMANKTQSEDTEKRFEAYGFEVIHVAEGNDVKAVHAALAKAKASTSGKPKFVVVRTLIGKGIAEVAGTAKAHGEGGAKFIPAAKKALGLPEEHFYVSDEVRSFFAAKKADAAKARAAWQATYEAWRGANPELAKKLDAAMAGDVPADLVAKIPAFPADAKLATRKAGEAALQAVAKEVPWLMGGCADLYGSTFNYIAESTDFDPSHWAGRNVRMGIREHGMGAILNGIAYHGGIRPSGSTFLVFADYLRPSIRVAALSHLPVVYVFTHDSVGVGEDGPTHQPVETVMGLRVIPNLDVLRPADPEETAGAWAAAMERKDGPTVLALTRQAVPMLPGDAATRRDGARLGGYVLVKETAALETILIATGSEVQHAVAAAKELGAGTRVVSLPCWSRFARQDAAYRESVLPAACRKRVSIEAGVTLGWHAFVGDQGKALGIDAFGTSAPGNLVMEKRGMTAAAVVAAARSLLASRTARTQHHGPLLTSGPSASRHITSRSRYRSASPCRPGAPG